MASDMFDGGPIKPVPFWSWNERLTADEVRRQLSLMAAAGWGGGFVHARVGLTTPYLEKDWFAAVDATMARCRELGLKVWLYDEDQWPSGFSGGHTPLAGEQCRMKVLLARASEAEAPPGARMLASSSGVSVYEWIAPLGNPWFNGTCYADLLSEAGTAQFLADAYESYASRYAADYGGLVTAQFTDEPSAIFRFGLPRGAVPWSTDLPSRFEQMHGHVLDGKLHLLFIDEPGAARFRWQYYRTVNDLFERNFSRRLGQFCQHHGLSLTGHFMAEGSLYEQQLWGVKVMPNYRHQHIPGIDYLARQVDEVLTPLQCRSVVNQCGQRQMLTELYGVSGQNLSFEDRWWIAASQIALGANLLNPHLALYTMSGCRKRDHPPNLFYQQPWWSKNAVLDDALGNLCGRMAVGQFVADALVVHPAESAWTQWQADAAPTDGNDADATDFNPTTAESRSAIEAVDKQLKALLWSLLGAQLGVDLGDEDLLADDAEVQTDAAGRAVLRVGRMQYPRVVIPAMHTIRSSTLALLARFRDAGGTMWRTAELPSHIDGEESDQPTVLLKDVPQVSSEALSQQLRQSNATTVQLDELPDEVAHRTLVHVRDLDDGRRLAFVINLHRTRGGRAKLKFPGRWRSAKVMDPLQGKELVAKHRRHGNRLEVELPLNPAQGHLIYLSEQAMIPSPSTRQMGGKAERVVKAVWPEKWQVERLDENTLPLDMAQFREGDGEWSTHSLPVLAVQRRLNALRYDGPLTLRYNFKVAAMSMERSVRLVVEYPERWSIYVNGQRVIYGGLPAWRDIRWSPIDVTGLLRDGNNVIEMHCEQFQHGDRTSIHDAARRYGTEAEAIMLVGDFSVEADTTEQPAPDAAPCPRWHAFGLPPVVQRRLAHRSICVTDPRPPSYGDVTGDGLPFYAGNLRLTTQLAASSRPRVLCLERLQAAVVDVALDGQTVGHFVSPPYELKLPAKGGGLSLTLYGTLRNLLGPHHHPEGEMPVVSPPLFEPDYQPSDDASVAGAIARWGRTGELPPRWTQDYWVVGFGDLGSVTIRE